MICTLIREGHTNVMDYGYDLLMSAIDELETSKKNGVLDMSFATRMAGADEDSWKKFMNASVPKKTKVKKTTTKSDHEKNMAAIRGLGK